MNARSGPATSRIRNWERARSTSYAWIEISTRQGLDKNLVAQLIYASEVANKLLDPVVIGIVRVKVRILHFAYIL